MMDGLGAHSECGRRMESIYGVEQSDALESIFDFSEVSPHGRIIDTMICGMRTASNRQKLLPQISMINAIEYRTSVNLGRFSVEVRF